MSRELKGFQSGLHLSDACADRVKIGDLVQISVVVDDPIGLVLTAPALSPDCMPGGEAYPNETYYTVVVLTPWGPEAFATDEIEVVAPGTKSKLSGVFWDRPLDRPL